MYNGFEKHLMGRFLLKRPCLDFATLSTFVQGLVWYKVVQGLRKSMRKPVETLDSLFVHLVVFADDITILSQTVHTGAIMLHGLLDALAVGGLDLQISKLGVWQFVRPS